MVYMDHCLPRNSIGCDTQLELLKQRTILKDLRLPLLRSEITQNLSAFIDLSQWVRPLQSNYTLFMWQRQPISALCIFLSMDHQANKGQVSAFTRSSSESWIKSWICLHQRHLLWKIMPPTTQHHLVLRSPRSLTRKTRRTFWKD